MILKKTLQIIEFFFGKQWKTLENELKNNILKKGWRWKNVKQQSN